MAASSTSAFSDNQMNPEAVQSQISTSKKRRNQPGNPNPDAEVIALSPKTLMATNRFVCEVCNKGFQREQNLQLHRRGHNLPWKLKQKSTKEVKRKVYLCPEPSCVHHDPARALGDLTGIKKHYSRKHGEKKYKCDKCSKKYAVHSDCKAHTKTCGTREYRCDCGTLFSRRDSFITHRAFCDALAQESARNLNPPPSLSSIGSHLLGLSQMSTPQEHHQMMNLHHHHHHHHQPSNILRLGSTSSSRSQPQPQPQPQPQQHGSSSRLDTFMFGSPTQPTSSRNMHQPPNYEEGLFTNKPSSSSSSVLHGQLMQLPQLHVNNNVNGGGGTSSSSNAAGTSLFNLSFFPNNMANNSSSGEDHSNFFSSGNLMSVAIPSLYSTSPHAQQQNSSYMSATALLQKAAQLGSTTSNNNNNNNPDTSNNSLLKAFGGNSNSSELHNQTAPSLNPDINFGGGSLVFGSENNNNNNNRSHFHDLMMNSINAGSSSSIFENAYNATTNGNHEQGNNIDDDDDEDEYGRGFGSGPTTVASFGRLTRDFLGVGEVMRRSTMDISSLDSQTGKSTTSSSFGGNFQ